MIILGLFEYCPKEHLKTFLCIPREEDNIKLILFTIIAVNIINEDPSLGPVHSAFLMTP